MQVLPELNQGGVERGTVELSRELAKKGHSSVVVSAGGKLADQIIKDGAKHITLDVCSKNPLTAALRVHRLKKMILAEQPDIVHARSRVPAWLCVFALKGLNIPFVTTVHGFNSVNPYSKVMTSGQRVICPSSAVKEYIIKHYKTPETKIRIVHRGVDLDEFSPEHLSTRFIEEFKQQHKLDGSFVASTVGRITQLKNFEAFIKAVGICSKTITNIKGLIIGGTRADKQDYFNQLKDLVVQLGLEEKVLFVGSQRQMAEIYALSDVVVACSKKPESFGRTIVEAMAMQAPVVSNACGGALDTIKDGKTGLLFEENSPEKIAECILKAKSMQFTGLREYVIENFSLDAMVENELEVYRELI